MKTTLVLTKNQTDFLAEKRQDPITGDSFSIGDEIVFCAECKSAFLKESWEYMGSRHCNQSKILSEFPPLQTLLLDKPMLNAIPSHKDAEFENRIPAFLIDAVLIFFISLVFVPVFWFLNIFAHSSLLENAHIFIGITLFIFRDIVLSNKSIGKHTLNLYFINTKTQIKASSYKMLFRNSVWFMIIVPLVYGVVEFESLFTLLSTMFLCVGYTLFFLTQNQSPIDKLLGIQLVKKNKVA